MIKHLLQAAAVGVQSGAEFVVACRWEGVWVYSRPMAAVDAVELANRVTCFTAAQDVRIGTVGPVRVSSTFPASLMRQLLETALQPVVPYVCPKCHVRNYEIAN